jgi:hypothetical protein
VHAEALLLQAVRVDRAHALLGLHEVKQAAEVAICTLGALPPAATVKHGKCTAILVNNLVSTVQVVHAFARVQATAQLHLSLAGTFHLQEQPCTFSYVPGSRKG